MEQLNPYRETIDAIDEQIIELLGRRYSVCRDVARLKKASEIPMMQRGRVEQVKQRCAALAERHGVDPGFVRELYTLIIDEACRIEDRIIDASD
ncbi:MAG: chorismate mutase [Gammaproteobacteria bacterium]